MFVEQSIELGGVKTNALAVPHTTATFLRKKNNNNTRYKTPENGLALYGLIGPLVIGSPRRTNNQCTNYPT